MDLLKAKHNKVCRKIDRLVEVAIELIRTSNNNEFLLYSDVISSQIPKSFAANAFSTLRENLFHHQILRLISIWDKSRKTDSILKIPPLLSEELINHCGNLEYERHASAKPPDQDQDQDQDGKLDKLFSQTQQDFAKEREEKAITELTAIKQRINDVVSDQRYIAIEILRNKAIAHNEVVFIKNGGLKGLKYGDEKWLLQETLEIVNILNIWIRGSDFDFESSHRIAGKNAEALWRGVSISVLR